MNSPLVCTGYWQHGAWRSCSCYRCVKSYPLAPDVTPSLETVDHPKHYLAGRKLEPIDVIEDWGLGFHLGCALKYISRAGRKGPELEDIEKAIWYLTRYKNQLKETP